MFEPNPAGALPPSEDGDIQDTRDQQNGCARLAEPLLKRPHFALARVAPSIREVHASPQQVRNARLEEVPLEQRKAMSETVAIHQNEAAQEDDDCRERWQEVVQ